MGKRTAAVARHAIALAVGVKTARTAINERSLQSYRVEWVDWNGEVVDVTEVRRGSIPEHDPIERPSTRRYDFEFNGWYPLLKPATENARYRARYLERDRKRTAQTVGFYNHVTRVNDRFTTYYRDGLFDTPSTDRNPCLTTFALCLALSSGHMGFVSSENADFAKAILGDIGCDRVRVNDYYFAEKKEISNIGVAIGVKDIGIPTLFVIVKGTYYGAEFGGNTIVGSESQAGGAHLGFSSAREHVLEYIGETISELGITGRIRMLTTGYSRGGAVSNLVASTVTDMLLDGTLEKTWGVTMEQGDMYGFCFEPALCQHDTDGREDRYGNILNVMDANDLVTKVPPRQYGFTVYGRRQMLPSNNPESVRRMMRYMDKYFGEGISSYYHIPEFVPHGKIRTLDQLLEFIMEKAIAVYGDREYYVQNLQDDLSYTIYAVMDNLDEARRALASFEPAKLGFSDILAIMFSREVFLERASRYVTEFTAVTNTDTAPMRGVAAQVHSLLRRSKAEDLYNIFVGLKGNYRMVGTPHYPLGPLSFLLMEDPCYRL